MTSTAVMPSRPSRTAKRLTRLAQLEAEGQASPNVERTIDKLIAHEIAEAQNLLNELEQELAEFESQHGCTSAEFY